jgi:ArsR family transcriptional regulator, arsenate/arsenite/antimonite-responsive transcriptional repressor
MKMKEAVKALSALSQDSRLAIFRLLVQAGPAGLSTGVIASKLGLPGPTLSFHLAQLDSAGLVHATRNGRFIMYAANYDRMQELIDYLMENCCQGSNETGSEKSCKCGTNDGDSSKARQSCMKSPKDKE